MPDTIKERTARLETQVSDIKDDVSEIKTNHLQHIQADLTSLKLQVNGLTVKMGFVIAVATILTQVGLKFIT